MSLTRRTLAAKTLTATTLAATTLAATTLAGLALPHVARAQAKVTFKLGGNLPSGHPAMIAADKAQKRIRAESNGEVAIDFFPNNQLGSESAMQSQLRSGALEMMTSSGLILQTLAPKAGISGMPFAFKDYAQVWPALDGEVGGEIRADLEAHGIYPLPRCMDNGFRNVTTSTKPITSVEDLSGLKIRVPPSPVWVSLFSTLGAAPTSINLNELYSALQTKIVDAQENPLVLIDSGKFYEVQKFCSMTGHLWDGIWVIANRRFWQGLPAEAKTLVMRVFDEETLEQRKMAERLNVDLETSLTQKGLVFNHPDKEVFRAFLRKSGFYPEWQKRYGAESWAKLEKYAGPL